MLNTDGLWVIYVLVFRDPKAKEAYYRQWKAFSLDNAGMSKTPDEATSSGECWQKTGIHGTFDKEIADRWLAMTRTKDFLKAGDYKRYEFAIQKVVISQHREVLT